MNIFHVNKGRGVLCLSQGKRMGYTACMLVIPYVLLWIFAECPMFDHMYAAEQ